MLAILSLSALLLTAGAATGAPGGGPAAPWFRDAAEAAGVAHPHHNRSFDNPYAHIMEGYTALGASAAVADYDGDGQEDLFVTDSAATGRNRLYRNLGDLRFRDMAGEAGVAAGNDAANASANALWFEADGDGRPDLLVVRFGRSLLYLNRGDGTFREVGATAGLDAYHNAIVALAFDHDGDGDLDLVLGNYFAPVNLFAPETSRFFPESFETADNGGGVTLYRNDGPWADGVPRFTDVTAAAGLADHTGWTLDLGHADYDLDGDQDLFVAADFGTDRLFRNRGDGTFEDVTAPTLGIDTKKGMNAEWADYDNDGLFDLYVTNITDEYMREGNFLWHNDGPGENGHHTFTDLARETGTWDTGWGWAGKFFDADNDGWLDLYVVNGWVSAGEGNYVEDIFQLILQPDADLAEVTNWPAMGTKTLSGYQRNELLVNRGGVLFEDLAAAHGVDSLRDGRGVAVADFDGDGRQDLFVANAGDLPHLWHNVADTGHHWVAFELRGSGANPEAVGARLRLTAGGRTWVSFVNGGNGFASQSSRRVHFGLAAADNIDKLEVWWPTGRRQTYRDLAADRLHRIREWEDAPHSADRSTDRPQETGSMVQPPDDSQTTSEPADADRPDTRDLDTLERRAAANPDDLRSGTAFRQAVIAAGADDRAIDLFRRLVDEHPDSYAAHLNLGYAYVDKIPQAGAVTGVILADKAVRQFTAALEIRETFLALYTRGNSYVYWPPIFGRTKLAIADLERAVELSEARGDAAPAYHANAYAALGDAHWRLGDLETARQWWQEGADRFPGHPAPAARLERQGDELEDFLKTLYAIGTRVDTTLGEVWAAQED